MKNNSTNEKLSAERNKIDEIDDVLIDLLDKRFEVSRAIGKIKKSEGLEILNSQREKNTLSKAEGKNNPNEIRNVLNKIMEESKNIQKKLFLEEEK